MVNFIHCPECHVTSEIKTESDEIMEEPTYCPFCGYNEKHEEDYEDEEEFENLDDYYNYTA